MPEEESGSSNKDKKQRPSARDIVSSIFEKDAKGERSPHEDSALFRPGPQPTTPPIAKPAEPASPAQKFHRKPTDAKQRKKARRGIFRTARIFTRQLLRGKSKPSAIPKPGEWTSYSEFPVGIEIGSTAIKAIQLARSNGTWELINCAIRPLNVGAKASIEDSSKELKKALTDIFPDPRVRLFVASTFSDPTSTAQVLKLPHIPQAEMKKAVAWELQEKFSMRSEDWFFDFNPLSPLPGTQQKELPVLISAVPKRELRLHAEILKSAGLLPMSVEIKPLPTFELMEGYVWPTDDAGLLIELGAEASYLIIVVNSQPAYIHSLEFTGEMLTKVVQGISGLSHADADQFKCRVGLSQVAPPTQTAEGMQQESLDREYQVYLAMRPFIDRFITEIEQVFKYYSFRVSMSEVRSFSKIVLSGKTSRLKGLQNLIEEKLSVPIDYVSCFRNVTIDNTVFNPEELETEALGLTTAMGLAQQRIGHG